MFTGFDSVPDIMSDPSEKISGKGFVSGSEVTVTPGSIVSVLPAGINISPWRMYGLLDAVQIVSALIVISGRRVSACTRFICTSNRLTKIVEKIKIAILMGRNSLSIKKYVMS
jgi:hypothetical protein